MTAFRDLPNAEYEGLRPVLSRPPVGAYMRDLWSRREFIFAVPRNSLRAQNMDTLLGNFWYLLNPALRRRCTSCWPTLRRQPGYRRLPRLPRYRRAHVQSHQPSNHGNLVRCE